jgi:hypothetical protein
VTGQWLPGVHPAPNIQEHPDLYEVENRAADPEGRIEAFWRDQGFASVRVESEWQFRRREDLEAVLGVEFPPALAEELRREHPGTSVDVHYLVHHRRF